MVSTVPPNTEPEFGLTAVTVEEVRKTIAEVSKRPYLLTLLAVT